MSNESDRRRAIRCCESPAPGSVMQVCDGVGAEMPSIRCAIVDDEIVAREMLRGMLGGYPEVRVVGEYADGFTALRELAAAGADLLFLNINLPSLSRIDLLRALAADERRAIVFVSAYDRYALRAFELGAIDYLLKPFDEARFHQMMSRALGRLRGNFDHDARLPDAQLPPAAPLELIPVRSRGSIRLLEADSIHWIEAEGKYVRLHRDKDAPVIREQISTLECLLDRARFRRISRSVIVRIAQIHEMRPCASGELLITLRCGSELHSTRGYRSNLDELITLRGSAQPRRKPAGGSRP